MLNNEKHLDDIDINCHVNHTFILRTTIVACKLLWVLLTDNQHLLIDGGCREGWGFHCHFAAEVTRQVKSNLPQYHNTLV
jgi:hypothetical protein